MGAAIGGVLWKKVYLEILQNSQGNICARVSILIKLQVSCEFWENFKNTYFYRTPSVAASVAAFVNITESLVIWQKVFENTGLKVCNDLYWINIQSVK